MLDKPEYEYDLTLGGADPAYGVMGLAPGCGRKAAHRKYLELAKVTHPDAGGTEAGMTELNAAYERLLELER
jgi:curved DNA-binding protein CbpA